MWWIFPLGFANLAKENHWLVRRRFTLTSPHIEKPPFLSQVAGFHVISATTPDNFGDYAFHMKSSDVALYPEESHITLELELEAVEAATICGQNTVYRSGGWYDATIHGRPSTFKRPHKLVTTKILGANSIIAGSIRTVRVSRVSIQQDFLVHCPLTKRQNG